jgi:hypothetical protein
VTDASKKLSRAERLRSGPQSGPGWHMEWAESAFDVDANGKPRRFQYIALDRIPPPWEGLDDVLVSKGYRSREELAHADQRRRMAAQEEVAA